MTEQQYEKALQALGAKNVTTERQRKNGTTAFKLPTGQVVSEHKSGYIRRYMYREDRPTGSGLCYQLNPTYKTVYKSIQWNGEEFVTDRNNRMLIWNRAERLKRLVLYTIKQINKSNG